MLLWNLALWSRCITLCHLSSFSVILWNTRLNLVCSMRTSLFSKCLPTPCLINKYTYNFSGDYNKTESIFVSLIYHWPILKITKTFSHSQSSVGNNWNNIGNILCMRLWHFDVKTSCLINLDKKNLLFFSDCFREKK